MKSYNITTQEQVDYVLTKNIPVISGADLWRATGETEEQHWTGPWQELKAKFDAFTATYTRRLRATLKRVADGETAELTATWSLYTTGDGHGGGGEGEEEEPPPGEDRDHPEYDLQTTTQQEPILTHPKWAGLTDDQISALKLVMDGYKRTERMTLEDGTKKTIYEILKPLKPKELLQLILKGVTVYNVPHTVLTVRYKAQAVPAIATTGSIVSSVPGGFATPAGRNWYFHGASWQMKGSELWVSEVYELSGVGGVDSFIYS